QASSSPRRASARRNRMPRALANLGVVERERDALAAQVARLEETVRTQDALLTAAAHDLKNSLAAITLRADLLLGQLEDDLQEPVPDGQESLSFRKGLARIVAASSQMARLLDE